MERGEGLLVRDADVRGPPDVLQPGVLRAHAGIVEAGRDRVRLHDLARGVLHQIGPVAVQHTRTTGRQGCRVAPRRQSVATGLDPVEGHSCIVQERMEEPDRVGASADAGHQRVGQPSHPLQALLASLPPDD